MSQLDDVEMGEIRTVFENEVRGAIIMRTNEVRIATGQIHVALRTGCPVVSKVGVMNSEVEGSLCVKVLVVQARIMWLTQVESIAGRTKLSP